MFLGVRLWSKGGEFYLPGIKLYARICIAAASKHFFFYF